MAYRIGFIIEQTLGHITHSQNLRVNVRAMKDIEAYWGLPSWETRGMASRIPIYNSNWTVRAGLRTRHELAEIRRLASLDALFFHTQVTAILSLDWMKRIPSVVSLDATPEQYDSLGNFYNHDKGPDWLEAIKWRLNHSCFHQACHLVTWSEWAKGGLVQGYGVPPEKITVIPPGVNIDEWTHPGQRTRSNGSIKILFVGGDFKRKGGYHLLEAFRTLTQEGPFKIAGKLVDLELHLVTRDSLPEYPGVFVYTDLQPTSQTLKQLYSGCDIFCLPTLGDCLPMVLSEAGASGLPLIATDVAAIHEIVRDGENGFLISQGDIHALAASLRKLISDPGLRNRMGAQAARDISQHYDARRNASQLLQLLKGVAEAGREADSLR